MPLTSMTGFAEGVGRYANVRWRWEAKSVNGRGLDFRLRVPAGFEGLEPGARTLAAERFKRGSIQAVLTAETEEGARGFRVDPQALADAVRIAKQVAAETGLPPARVDGLLGLRGVIIQEEQSLGEDARLARDAALLESLSQVLDALADARRSEGAKLTRTLAAQLDEMARFTAEARKLADAQPKLLQERMLAQLSELLAPGRNLPEDRIAQEVALLAARADTREELDRLAAHCQEARALLAAHEPVGRKIDFLAQEFNREANTLCAKSADIQLTRVGLALKAVIDQFREQIQNVE
ncbi:MAG: YicC/YloC family endoribonuclease [Alphaproteobacteria bacterium]